MILLDLSVITTCQVRLPSFTHIVGLAYDLQISGVRSEVREGIFKVIVISLVCVCVCVCAFL